MPAINAPIDSQGNPLTLEDGQGVLMNPFSGPLGSPFDNDQAGNGSTGALNTGIGFGNNMVTNDLTNEDYIPGITNPDGTAATDATLIAIGGGHSDATDGGIADTTPYDEQPLMVFGLGGLRDSEVEPAATGFESKYLSVATTVSAGGTISGSFNNNTGINLVSGNMVLATASGAFAAITPDYLLPTIDAGDVTPTITAPDLPVETYTSATAGVIWSINGGADAELFEFADDTVGDLSFIAASVAGTYEVIIRLNASAGGGGRNYLITVTVNP